MAASDKWYFTKDQLEITPSRKCGYDSFKELSHRQQAANFIQDMGQRLKVSQLCINTAIVYMHRFYVFHSFTKFPWFQMASAALFLAAKVEEQPRKLEYVIRVANVCRNSRDNNFDITSDRYLTQSQDLVFNENVLLQTLGFDVAIDHPHTHVVKCCQMVRASKDLAQTSYFMASNSLHLTTMCLQYKPTVVACFCIHLACKWSNWEIPLSNERKEWFSYVDPTVTSELLQQLTEEFLVIFANCPSRLKEKIMALGDNIPHPAPSGNHANSLFDNDPKKIREDSKDFYTHRPLHDSKSGADELHKHRSQSQREREYREKKEKERLVQQHHGAKPVPSSSGQKPLPHGHHRPVVDPKHKSHSSKPPSAYPPQFQPSSSRTGVGSLGVEPRDILRESVAARDSPFGLAVNSRDSHAAKEAAQVRNSSSNSDFLSKSSDTTDPTNNLMNKYADSGNRQQVYGTDKHRVDPNNRSHNRLPTDPNKVPSKHEMTRNRHDESKPYVKSDSETMKKHLNTSGGHFNKPTHFNSTSQQQKVKIADKATESADKSVPTRIPSSQTKTHQHNGSSNSSRSNINSNYNFPLIEPDEIKTEIKTEIKPEDEIEIKTEIKTEIQTEIKTEIKTEIDDEIQTPVVVKRPSLFSPEKTPPRQEKFNANSLPNKYTIETHISSILESPLKHSSSTTSRTRNYSSSSEPELRPVMKKIDQVEGFENLLRESTIGINRLSQISDMVPPDIKRELIKTELPSSDESDNKSAVAPMVNGIETNSTLISNLLKTMPTVSHLNTTTNQNVSDLSGVHQTGVELPTYTKEVKEKDRERHKSKKKNKEKHKHKDKDRNREDKEKKKKHKDKDRERHRHKEKYEVSEESFSETMNKTPLVIKIQKDKIQSLPDTPPPPIQMKIKIPKDKIRSEVMGEFSSATIQHSAPLHGPLKIKISKDVINNCSSEGMISKKRDRSFTSNDGGPSSKMAKTSHRESKQNGRHSYNKVSPYQNNEQRMSLPPQRYSANMPMPFRLRHPMSMPRHCVPGPPPPPHNSMFFYQHPPPHGPRHMSLTPQNLSMPIMHPQQMPMSMSRPPPPLNTYVYQQQFYNPSFPPMYPPNMYQSTPMPITATGPPPLPSDAPPNNPPPPPPPE